MCELSRLDKVMKLIPKRESVKIGSELKHVMVIVGNVAGALNLSGDQGKWAKENGGRC